MITFCPEIRCRSDLALLCNRRGLVGTAVEIGVHHATFAAQWLKKWQGAKYYGVDPYQPTEIFPWPRNQDKRTALKALSQFPHAELVEADGATWLATLAPGRLSSFYVDDDHTYEMTARHIRAGYAALCTGGMAAGHDFLPCFPGVVRAVREFSDREGVDVFVTDDVPVPGEMWSGIWSWFAFKPGAPCT